MKEKSLNAIRNDMVMALIEGCRAFYTHLTPTEDEKDIIFKQVDRSSEERDLHLVGIEYGEEHDVTPLDEFIQRGMDDDDIFTLIPNTIIKRLLLEVEP